MGPKPAVAEVLISLWINLPCFKKGHYFAATWEYNLLSVKKSQGGLENWATNPHKNRPGEISVGPPAARWVKAPGCPALCPPSSECLWPLLWGSGSYWDYEGGLQWDGEPGSSWTRARQRSPIGWLSWGTSQGLGITGICSACFAELLEWNRYWFDSNGYIHF